MRMLVSRLPLVPNKDVVFAGIAAFWVGSHSDVAALLYLITGFTLTAHLAVAAALGLFDLIATEEGSPSLNFLSSKPSRRRTEPRL